MDLQVKGNILGTEMDLVCCLFVATPFIKNVLKVSCSHTHSQNLPIALGKRGHPAEI